jgi:hypothetical protein
MFSNFSSAALMRSRNFRDKSSSIISPSTD